MSTNTETTEAKKSKRKNRANGTSPRAPAGARARKTVDLRLGDVIVDEVWNSRSIEHASGTGAADTGPTESPERELTDEELRASIQREGIIQACGVRLLSDGYHLVWGFRRYRAAFAVLGENHAETFVLKPKNADPAIDDYEALALNLQENMQRKNLKPFEIAKTLARMRDGHPAISDKELAADVGISYSYASNLLRVAKKSCPQLWDIFCSYGTNYGNGITYKDFVSIVKRPKDEQMAAWAALVDERTGKPAGGAKSGSAGNGSKSPSLMALEGFLLNIDRVEGPEAFRAGLACGLQVAIGNLTWSEKAWSKLQAANRKAAKKKAPKKKASKKAAKKKASKKVAKRKASKKVAKRKGAR